MRKTVLSLLVWLAVVSGAMAAGPPVGEVPFVRASSKEEAVAKLQVLRKTLSTLPPRVTPEQKLIDEGTYYRVGQTTVPLLRVAEEYAVRYRPGTSYEAGLRALKDAGVNVERVGTCVPTQLDILRLSADAAAGGGRALRSASSMVEKVYPVFVYPQDNARMIAGDDVIVCVEDEATLARLSGALANARAQVVRRLPSKNAITYLVRLEPDAELDALGLCEMLHGQQGVLWAEPDFTREIFFDFTPNDPLFSMQQSHHNTGSNGAVADADVDAPEAWDVSVGSSSIVIAIIDDGVDTSHTDLLIAPGGYDFYNNDSDPSPTGTNGHGTGCAGVAAAVINNNYRTAGIAGGCKILPIKIAESTFASNTVIGNAIQYAADHADVLSNSWGGGGSSSFINTAIDYAVTNGRGGKGCPVFFASGNSASGWYQGGGRYRLSTSGLSGTYRFAFDYWKDVAISSGLDTVYIDNVCLLSSDGYTHIWREDFEGASFPPSGWTLVSSTGTNFWYRTTTNAYTATGGSYSARAGAIGNNQWTDLRTPLMTITGTETLAFAAYISSQAGKDGLYVDVYDSSDTYIGSWGLFSGVPTISTAVAYPANYVNTIAVGAASDCDRRSDYSQYGPELDFVAPSNGGWNDIVTLDPIGSIGWTSTDYKTNFGGTSSACPLAAGIGALRLSYSPTTTASALRSWMRANCDKIGGVVYSGGDPGAGGRNDQYGYGRVNAFLMVPVTVSHVEFE
ncbi:MAG: S8 family serine peptidase [Candidatus Sumerlaea chitinivorans]|uniref:Peptidase S8/S53 domain-containing protein n=1 Tax=Sumerlaea chitinivorans TaxID=2250252 RepID=A0A2Z4Y599_SUMC1|nr:hypothetical protein BRCON_1349 [Candidatus Sumerlaea chitinivorans]MCX7964488.1 S8 family serine peptidase [Candidatus Sumerlaea chitinivorans]